MNILLHLHVLYISNACHGSIYFYVNKFWFETSFRPLVRRASNRNQDIGHNFGDKKFPASFAWYLALGSRMNLASSEIITSADLDVKNKGIQASKLLRLVVSIKL